MILVAKLATAQFDDVVVSGSGDVAGTDIMHSNGNVYDQVLLTGERVTVRADVGQITRTSFIDENDDIVQVEMSGDGEVTIVLDPDTFSGPALPSKYNQFVFYVKGRPSITIDSATENTFFSIFSVGKDNSNPALYPDDSIIYDSMANITLLQIFGTGFGGILAANALFSADEGTTGIIANDVDIRHRLVINDIDARGSALPVLRIGQDSELAQDAGALLIAGGDLLQSNGARINVSTSDDTAGFGFIRSQNNFKSDGTELPARAIQATFENSLGQVINIIGATPPPDNGDAGFAPQSLDGKVYQYTFDGGVISPLTISFSGDSTGTFTLTQNFFLGGIEFTSTRTGTFTSTVDSNDPNKGFLSIAEHSISVQGGVISISGTIGEVASTLDVVLALSSQATAEFFFPTSGKFTLVSTYTDGLTDLTSGSFKQL